ncbi:unnamed protein product [Cylicocyclus nassatus]|uniref:Uncharacterized protein n=2 Tax=Strongylidae TaxID=27830 RepID=A0AA36MGS6_CYLNA|nr:unnamed protein product [Cylicocyclus nassatus]
MKWNWLTILLLVELTWCISRKKTSAAERVFDKNDDLDWARPDEDPEEERQTSKKDLMPTTEASQNLDTTETAASAQSTESINEKLEENTPSETVVVSALLIGADSIWNLTKQVEEEFLSSQSDSSNRTVLWIDASYKAEDYKLNTTLLAECQKWKRFWSLNRTEEEEEKNATSSAEVAAENLLKELKETELIKDKKKLKKLGLDENLLKEYQAVGLVYKEICGDHGRILWFRDTADAKNIGITEASPICEPFKEDLTPDLDKLELLAKTLDELIQNFTLGIIPQVISTSVQSTTPEETDDVVATVKDDHLEETTVTLQGWDVRTHRRGDGSLDFGKLPGVRRSHPPEDETSFLLVKEAADHIVNVEEVGKWRAVDERPEETKKIWTLDNAIVDGPGDYPANIAHHYKAAPRSKREEKSISKKKTGKSFDDDDEEWQLTMAGSVTESPTDEEKNDGDVKKGNASSYKWIEIVHTEEAHPTLLLSTAEAVEGLSLKIPSDALHRFEKIGLFLPGICADYVPKAIDEFNSSSFAGVEIEGPIGVNITALEAAGVNLTALAEKLRNDTEVDEILSRTNASTKTLGGSYILPVLSKNQYDPFSAPIVFQGSAVVVRFGIYIESMSNFQTSTMDYDMDIYLMMSWRDARLVTPYDKPILVKEEEILEKIWRPDPFFANAKEAEFHEVTFLNFLMRIFPDGLVLYETRVKIKPSCNLILCKYPHDKQTCDLLIKSFAYPVETVQFEWFTRRADAIDKNPDVKLPELYIDRYEPTTCTKARKSGAFSCLRAVFRLKRDVGFHIAQTYIPTSLALMFSWVGVWLPEEFMEGRIGVAITVLLTLSTESAGAREHLPSVSYLKAIDLWFGFITGFVFFTLLQTLFVIGFDKRANQLKKWALKGKSDMTEDQRDMMMQKAQRYHKTGRYLDNFCRVFYPLSFLLFLIMYYFVFTEGRQDDCISRR